MNLRTKYQKQKQKKRERNIGNFSETNTSIKLTLHSWLSAQFLAHPAKVQCAFFLSQVFDSHLKLTSRTTSIQSNYIHCWPFVGNTPIEMTSNCSVHKSKFNSLKNSTSVCVCFFFILLPKGSSLMVKLKSCIATD